MSTFADRYELGEPLGHGGMARVLAARDRMLDRHVAIKLVHEDFAADATSRQRLLREARAAAGLNHPNTVAVYDVGEHDGQPFIVMELVEGESLAELLARRGALATGELAPVADAVLAGLSAAHKRGLVHRDIKPSNILLPDAGGVKLADFGIATALGTAATRLTATGMMIGTPRYLAPEQAAGEQASPASDVYSVGVVLYECLAGRAPFEADSPLAQALAHQREPVPPLAEIAPHVPAGFAAAVGRALAKDPAERFAGAQELREALTGEAGAPRPAATRAMTAGPGTTGPGTAGPGAASSEGAYPGGARSRGAGAPRRRVWVVLAAAVSVLALAALGAVAAGERQVPGQPSAAEQGPAAGDDGSPSPGEGPPEGNPGEADPPGDAEAAEQEGVAGLLAQVAAHPDAGERGDELIDELRDVRDAESETERAEQARELIEELAEWVADEEIDHGIGTHAITVLEAEARPATPVLVLVSTLFADVARDLPGWGEQADSLLAGLADLLGEPDADERSEDASELREDIAEWIDDGELEVSGGQHARAVLAELDTG